MKRKTTLLFVLILGFFLLSVLPVKVSHAQSIDAAEITSLTCDGFTIGTRADLGTVDFTFQLVRTDPPGPSVVVSGSLQQTVAKPGAQFTTFSWGDFPGILYVLVDGTLEGGDYDIPTTDIPAFGTAGTATLSGFNTIPLHFSDPPIFCEGSGEGCTPGFWKNHLADWAPTGYSPGDDFDSVFGTDLFDPDITLFDAVWAKGGGVQKIARHGTAALLSASHPDVAYPFSVQEVITAVQSGDVSELVNANELETPGFCE